MFSGVSATLGLTCVAILLSSCTHFQERTWREIHGTVINPDSNQPLAGVTLVLTENRHPFLPFPMMTDYSQAIAHTTSDDRGRFLFKACITEPYWIVREEGGLYPGTEGFKGSEWSNKGDERVTVTLFARPALAHERELSAELVADEDATLIESCR